MLKNEKDIFNIMAGAAMIFTLMLVSGCAFARTKHSHVDIIDSHMHVYFDTDTAKGINQKRIATPDNFIISLKNANISAAWALVVAKKGNMLETEKLNDRLIEFAEKNRGVVIPAGSVHPDDKEGALKEMERISKLGVKVLKLHPNMQNFDVESPDVQKVAEKAGELKMVLLFDAYSPFDANETGKFIKLCVSNPNTKFILAHMGGLKFTDMLVFYALRQYPWYPNNVWFDTSFVATMFAGSPYQEQLVWVIRKIGVDRFLYGSDYPIFDTEDAIAGIEKLGFTCEEKRRIFYENAKALLTP
ncbi:MAG: amidohydrolase family protein [Elusimicrobiales bacterium]|nr:amidohydrolase family protein [Elusimicrobiales bacterium]